MGTWGTSLYSDDLASDVKESFLTLVGDGVSSQKATKQVFDEYSELDDEELPVFWIALAHTQWKCGRLLPAVKKKAVDLIQSGADLERWETPSNRKKRASVLARVLAEISSASPSPKNVRKRFREDCKWKVGEVIGYELKSGTRVLFRVCGHDTDAGGRRPIVELFKWTGKPRVEYPTQETIRKMKLYKSDNFFMIGRTGLRSYPEKRIFRTNIVLPPINTRLVPLPIQVWQSLDLYLGNKHGIK
jgi:hypothetical protein